VESVLPSGIEAVVVDACRREFTVAVNKTCRVAAYCDLGWRMFWGARASGYKWQYILTAAFPGHKSIKQSNVA